ncbi:MAG: mandelate racemase/muconate lactonizing enzyme family protein [Anaerolineales bacterium]|nr:mandelate racemase/muconate lactonizing enzyme family protein [Anaerolineales bacterium]MBP6210073.1 mandelate racemase/muconate lactonizing enzyme family protein [Anaerolineales bacterium]
MSARPEDHVNQHSRPSDLRITDIRTATVGWEGWRFPIVRIETNQGLVGYGEVRDGASKTFALMLKSRLVGENPCNVDKVFRKIKQFGHHARQGGGVCGIEMALMDLAGKAYNVPAYMLAGGKFRDSIRMYCDTPNEPTGEAMGHKLKERMANGFTMLKMDIGIQPLIGVKGALTYPAGMLKVEDGTALDRMLDINSIQHPFTHVRLTPKGIEMLCEYVEQVRAVVGYEVPISADHFGHIGVDDCIKLGEALEPFNLCWLEDMVPWQFTDQWVKMERALKTPVCTGEDIYLKEGFLPLLQAHAVNVIHPDLATSGGILETKKIGDLAQEYGVSMALHMAGTPISTMAAVQCAAATENFIALEHHFTDVPFWGDFIDGPAKPLIQNGYIPVPDAPGLGFTLNEDAVREHLIPEDRGFFEPTTEWDNERSWDRLWS